MRTKTVLKAAGRFGSGALTLSAWAGITMTKGLIGAAKVGVKTTETAMRRYYLGKEVEKKHEDN